MRKITSLSSTELAKRAVKVNGLKNNAYCINISLDKFCFSKMKVWILYLHVVGAH